VRLARPAEAAIRRDNKQGEADRQRMCEHETAEAIGFSALVTIRVGFANHAAPYQGNAAAAERRRHPKRHS